MNDMTPGLGHNNPPLYDEARFSDLQASVRALAETGGQWLDLKQIDSEDRAQKAVDFTAQVKKAAKFIEDERKRAKQPHLDAGKAVDAAFQSLTAPLTKLADGLGRMLTAYQREKQRRLDEERRQREAEERARAEEARKAAKEAARRNDVIGQAEAEKAAAEAEKAAQVAAKPERARVESATGGARTMALRTYWIAGFDPAFPEDVARTKAFITLSRNPEHRTKLDALLLQLAEAERRAKDGAETIPGITFTSEQRAV